MQTVTLSAFSNCSNVSLISGGVEFGSDLSVVKLTNAEYNKLVVDRKVNISAIYIITDTFIDAKGQ